MVLGLVAAVVFAQGSPLRAVGAIFLGLLLGLIGADVNTGFDRFTFDRPELRDGIGVVVVSMGLFGIAEIMLNLSSGPEGQGERTTLSRLWLTKEDFRAAWPATLRGTGLGALLGILPGGGAKLSSFTSKTFKKQI